MPPFPRRLVLVNEKEQAAHHSDDEQQSDGNPQKGQAKFRHSVRTTILQLTPPAYATPSSIPGGVRLQADRKLDGLRRIGQGVAGLHIRVDNRAAAFRR